jgi:diacylglycerol kinase (ATP)
VEHPLTPLAALRARPRHLVVVNPNAGRNRHQRLIRAIAGAFAARGAAFDLVETEGPGHATQLARAGVEGGYGAIVAVGGDGTIGEVVAGVAGSPIPIGIIPRGTGNQLASNLGIPFPAEAAVGVIVDGYTEAMDLGRLGDGRLFTVAAGAGWDAAVMHATTREMKERWGYAAYLLAALRTGTTPPISLFRIVADGRLLEVPASMVLVANMGQIAAALRSWLFQLAPDANHKDGKLDVVVFAPRHLPDVARLLWGMARRVYPGDERLLFIQCEHVSVEADPDVFTEVDGEPLGRTPLDVGIVREAVRVLVPDPGRVPTGLIQG